MLVKLFANTIIDYYYYYHYRKQGVILYIFFLPFALVDSLAWLVTPIVALVSFTLFGIEAIGAEIENPCKLLVLLQNSQYVCYQTFAPPFFLRHDFLFLRIHKFSNYTPLKKITSVLILYLSSWLRL